MKRITIGLAFIVTASPLLAQQPVKAERSKAADRPDARICKRSAPTGSLVQTRRECHTQQEWDQIAQSGRVQAQDMVDRANPTGR